MASFPGWWWQRSLSGTTLLSDSATLQISSVKQEKKLNIYRTCVLFLWICANPNFFYIHKKWNSILTSLHWAHKKNKNYRGDTIDLLMLHCVFIKNGEIYVITAPSFVVWKHFLFL